MVRSHTRFDLNRGAFCGAVSQVEPARVRAEDRNDVKLDFCNNCRKTCLGVFNI